MNEEINLDVVTKAFKYAKSFSPSVYQYHNQYKLLRRPTARNKLCMTDISRLQNDDFVTNAL